MVYYKHNRRIFTHVRSRFFQENRKQGETEAGAKINAGEVRSVTDKVSTMERIYKSN